MHRIAPLALLLALAGCALDGPAPRGGGRDACLLETQRPMTVAQLFFGRDVAGRAPVSDAEWAEFRTRVIAAQFPDGFTVFDADGQGRGGRPDTAVRERTKVLLVAVPRGGAADAAAAAKLRAVMDAYTTQFRQAAVGIITTRGCGAF